MSVQSGVFLSNSPSDTEAFARDIGRVISSSDTLLLHGPVGVGKTHFARSLIQALMDVPEDVPSPTYTLVQTYNTNVAEVWHADLYRISDAVEIEELGLTEAFESAICLIEWPEILGDEAPRDAVSLFFATGIEKDQREIILRWTDPKWQNRLADIIDD